ncbi:MAG: hypothetical protein RL481_1344 [Pseudomonadota bacterium]|jgi:hypothetical protein
MLWLLLSTATPAASFDPYAEPKAETLKIDILIKQPEPECAPAVSDEIIVCAEPEDNERYRLRPIPNAKKLEEGESKAEFGIGDDATLAAESESEEIGGGVISQRLIIRLKVPF